MGPLRLALFTLLFIFFFGESLSAYGLLPKIINSGLPDLIICGLFFAALMHAKKRFVSLKWVGLRYVVLLVVLTILSLIMTSASWLSVILFFRLLLRFYILYMALINIGMSERDQRWCLHALALLFLIQIPVAVLKLFLYGQGESAIGTYATHGGGNSTAIPMVAACFLVSYYIISRRSSFLLLLLAFIAFGIIGGKRAVFFLVPITILFSIWQSTNFSFRSLINSYRYIVSLGILLPIVIYLAVRLSPTLTPEQVVMGSFDVNHLISYVMENQVHAYSEEGQSQGRYSTTTEILNLVNKDVESALFGLGPGLLLKTGFEGAGREKSVDEHGMSYGGPLRGLNVVYGISGFSWLLAQIGWPGTMVWLVFYVYLLRRFNQFAQEESVPYWKAYYNSMTGYAFVILLISATYGSYMIMGDLLVFVFFLLASIGEINRNQQRARTLTC